MTASPAPAEPAPPTPRTLAERAGVSRAAAELLLASEVIDLHLESFIPTRLYGYDLGRRHGKGVLRGRYFGHLDFPRALEAGLTGAMWSIATNVFRSARGRRRVLERNLARLGARIDAHPGMRVVRTYAEYRAARAAGDHAAWLSVQGGNALSAMVDDPAPLPPSLCRVTLIHLTDSSVGTTSSPLRLRGGGLTDLGRRLVERLDAERIFVDLAHAHPKAFWDAVDVHDPARPLLVTHTGVQGARRHWRNVDDDQIRAVADSGGVVGILFEPRFLRRRGQPRDGRMVVEHLAHLVRVGGEGAAAIGSDFDGLIAPPADLSDGSVAYVRLVQYMLDAKLSEDCIVGVLGRNFLRAAAVLG